MRRAEEVARWRNGPSRSDVFPGVEEAFGDFGDPILAALALGDDTLVGLETGSFYRVCELGVADPGRTEGDEVRL